MPKREKRRYVVVAVKSETSLTHEQLSAAAAGCVVRLFGAWGLAKVSPCLIHVDSRKKVAVFRVRKDSVKEFRLSLELSPPTAPVRFRVVRTTGTLRKALRYVSSTEIKW